MNLRVVLYILGVLLILLAGIMVAPLAISLAELWGWEVDPGQAVLLARADLAREVKAFVLAIGAALAAGLLLFAFCRRGRADPLRGREGFTIVTLGWLAFSAFGALPFLLSGVLSSPVDAFFETMSGLTTTGASVIRDVEVLPRGIIFWRSLTHWLGGMGIIVLSLAILPALGAGGYHLLKAEYSGTAQERLRPRIAQTAKVLWGVYCLFSLAEVLCLWAMGLTLFDACCNTFGTLSTGGFSTRNLSIGQYGSLPIEMAVLFFMLLGGCNFALYFQLLRGEAGPIWRNRELRVFIVLLAAATAAIALCLWLSPAGAFPAGGRRNAPGPYGPGEALRYASFQVVSSATCTGFVSDNFDAWPCFAQAVLILLMITGGCAGSTSGGIKIFRIMIVAKVIVREVRLLLRPRAVVPLVVAGKLVDPQAVRTIMAFFALYLSLAGGAILLLCVLSGADLVAAGSAVVSCMGNVGPGLGRVGAWENYAFLPDGAKIVLAACMLLGRLEIYGVLALIALAFRRR